MNQNIKVAVITGGSRGLGRSTVINLAQRGIHSIFTYKSGQQEAAEVVKEAEKAGAKAIALYLDTANIAGFDDFAAQVQEALRELNTDKFNYLVNNAGISNHTPFMQVTEEELDLQFQVNF